MLAVVAGWKIRPRPKTAILNFFFFFKHLKNKCGYARDEVDAPFTIHNKEMIP